jgi:Zn-dependent membrane protease YugP
MREFITEIFIPTIAYFVGVALCIGAVVFSTAVVNDLVSSPIEFAQEDAQ